MHGDRLPARGSIGSGRIALEKGPGYVQEVSTALRQGLLLPSVASVRGRPTIYARLLSSRFVLYTEVDMAKNWYPIVNEALCANCNTCVDFCTHGVWQSDDSHPVVVNPDNCVEFCRGCAKICPNDAITYFGDN